MSRYFVHVIATGPVRYGRFPFAIGVLEALDKPMPIGMVFGVGCTEDGLAIWRPTIHGYDVPGWWVIVDREFQQAE
jgi:hypothetical protein